MFPASAELAAVAAILGRLPNNRSTRALHLRLIPGGDLQLPEFRSGARVPLRGEEGRSIAKEIVVSA